VNLIASRAHALAEPARVRMIEALSRSAQSVGELASSLGMQQSSASKHLQVLFRAGLVDRRREASAVIYSVVATDLIALCRYLGYRQLASAAGLDDRGTRMDSSHSCGGIRAARRSNRR
jgi:ArsR family transcriptional regulator